jgi:alanine-glyoxylate transaminase/serine-glyoxylate transaminase/serine-pyruvate transaminase
MTSQPCNLGSKYGKITEFRQGEKKMNEDFSPPQRILMGPGPSNVNPKVLEGMSKPVIGHLDPQFVKLMNEVQQLLRKVFQTSNQLTIPISGTGSAGMEAAVANFVEEGDAVLVGVHGVFGQRLAEEARRCRAQVTTVEAPFGEPLQPEALKAAAEACRPKVLAVVHAETSTGVLQPLKPIREICDQYEVLLLVDSVTSLGGHPVAVDNWGIDICYSGTQKCLSCPPGLSPFTASEKAVEHLQARESKCQSWYLDLSMVCQYWGEERTYHHTAPVSMIYGLREALKLVVDEGLQTRWNRHQKNHLGLVAGIEAMGLKMHVAEEFRLWSLNTVAIPEAVDDLQVRQQLLSDFNIEIGGGLGELQGKVWRVGLMGETSRSRNILYFLHALERCLQSQGHHCPGGAGIAAASEILGRLSTTEVEPLD